MELPENMDIALRYFDARIFESLLTVLSDDQKLDFLNPALQWLYVNRKAELQLVDSAFANNDGLYVPLVFTEPQVDALLGAPDYVFKSVFPKMDRAGPNYSAAALQDAA